MHESLSKGKIKEDKVINMEIIIRQEVGADLALATSGQIILA